MLYDVPARGKVHTLRRICCTRLPTIFVAMTGILTKSRLERKQDVEDVLIGTLGGYSRIVKNIVAELKSGFYALVVKLIGMFFRGRLGIMKKY